MMATPQIMVKNGLLILESFRRKKLFNRKFRRKMGCFHHPFPPEKKFLPETVTEFPVDTLLLEW